MNGQASYPNKLSRYYQGFTSERLLFRKVSLADVNAWASFFEANPSLPYLNMQSIEEDSHFMAERWIRRQLTRYEQQRFGQLAIIRKTDGVFIGMTGFKCLEYEGKSYPECVCFITKEYRRQGYFTEALKRCVHFIFDEKLGERILFCSHQQNVTGQQAILSLGFRQIDLMMSQERKAYLYEVTPTMNLWN